MVRINKVYTRTGDDGSTGLGDGSRRSKADLRVAAVGDLDEANAVIGLARREADAALDAVLARIQNDLFDLGADLCTPLDGDQTYALRVTAAQSSLRSCHVFGFFSACGIGPPRMRMPIIPPWCILSEAL